MSASIYDSREYIKALNCMNEGNFVEAERLLKPIFMRNPFEEGVAQPYSTALVYINPSAAIAIFLDLLGRYPKSKTQYRYQLAGAYYRDSDAKNALAYSNLAVEDCQNDDSTDLYLKEQIYTFHLYALAANNMTSALYEWVMMCRNNYYVIPEPFRNITFF
jgi:tetratricopeptide (TPR) repeat protein